MARVTGIGGIFFKSNNPEKTRTWYSEKLGITTDSHGTSFEWRQSEDPNMKGFTVWSPFSESTEYFEPSKKEYMINFRVDNLRELIQELDQQNVEIVGEIDEYEYGLFAHIIDPEGTKIELWEPHEREFEKMATSITK